MGIIMKKLFFLFSIITIFFFFSDAYLSQKQISVILFKEKLNKELESILLPDSVIVKEELPLIYENISIALDIILQAKLYHGNKLSGKTNIVSLSLSDRLKLFVDWLENKKCVKKVDLPLLSGNEYNTVILLTSNPAKIKMKIEFLMANDVLKSKGFTFQINQKKGFKLIDFSLK